MMENNVEPDLYALRVVSLERLICELLSKNEQLRTALLESPPPPRPVCIEETMVAAPSTRERILHQGLDLISTSGISGLTLGVLAEQTGMSKSGLFAHFGSKEEVQLGLLDQMAVVAERSVVAPAMIAPEGLERLKAVLHNWFGWTKRAGLQGGCPVAAGMFELDDLETPVRARLLRMECHWREFLKGLTDVAVEQGELRSDLNVDQFVWELCGIYLSHHASYRFVRDPNADARALEAFDRLLKDALPTGSTKISQKKKTPKRKPKH